MTCAIDIKNLTKTYKGKRLRTVTALSGISLQIPCGEIFGFLGPNGAGKSTTIKTLTGLIRATTGEAFLFEQPVTQPETRRRVGFLPENPVFYDFLTAREYLVFVGRSFAMEQNLLSRRIDEVLERVQLTSAADRQMRGYSKGMVQRLGLAQTLVHDPDLFILDEPMSGLDPLGRALVKEIIIDLKNQGKTVFFSTHITSDVEAVCDRVGVIVGGRIRTVQPVDTLFREGVQGYLVRARGQWLQGHDLAEKRQVAEGIWEFFAQRDDLNSLLQQLTQNNCTVEFVEPRRKNLETFFLEIVKQSETCG